LAVYHGCETKGRVAEILAFVVFLPLLALLIPGIIKTDYSNILPVLTVPHENYLFGAFECGYAFAGMELLLIAAPFVAMPGKNARRGIIGAVIFMGGLLTVLTALVIARFGADGVLAHDWPLLEALFTIEIPGEFMERQNAVVISFWILTVFMGVGMGLFFGSVLLRDTVGRGKRRKYMVGLMPVILFLALFPDTASNAMDLSRAFYRYTYPVLALLLPFVLLVIARIRRLGDV
jgi:spore germination protein